MAGEKNEPYKPHRIIERVQVPQEIREVLKTEEEIVGAAAFCFSQGRQGSLLPEGCGDIERWFGSVYDYS